MKTQDFCNQVESLYAKHFPLSKCTASFSDKLYRDIWIHCFLAGDRLENSGGYWDNDMLHVRFQISTPSGELPKDVNLDSELPDSLLLDVHSKSYWLKPDSPYVAYGRKSLSFRKSTGNAEKLLKVLDKYFATLRESLESDLLNDKIHDSFVNLLRSKLVK